MLAHSYLGLRTALRLKDVSLKSLKEIAQREVIRAPAFAIKELRYLFKRWNIEFSGRFEECFSETPFSRLVPRMDVRFEASSKLGPRSRVGGMPNSTPNEDIWPTCQGCERPMHFIGQLVGPIKLSRVSLGSDEAIQLFACFYTDSFCMSWDPKAGANSAILISKLKDSTRNSSTPPFPPFDLKFSDGWDNNIITTRVVEESDLDEYLEACHHALTDKLGGIPLRVGNPGAPTCPRCHVTMAVVAQLSSERVPNPLGDGVCYIHVCPNKHSASLEFTEKI